MSKVQFEIEVLNWGEDKWEVIVQDVLVDRITYYIEGLRVYYADYKILDVYASQATIDEMHDLIFGKKRLSKKFQFFNDILKRIKSII